MPTAGPTGREEQTRMPIERRFGFNKGNNSCYAIGHAIGRGKKDR
jgi:hypothetical protein